MSIYKRKGNYWINIRYNGIRYRKACPENSSAGAKAYEALLRQKIAKEGNLAFTPEKKKETISTFSVFSKKWFDVYVKTNNKYSETLNKASVLKAHLVPFFGNKPLDKICNLDVETYKAEKQKIGLANKTINNHLIVLNKCLNTAQDWEVIKIIPKIKLLKVPPQKFDFLSAEECQELIDNSEGMYKEMILLCLKTGVRFGELIALRWEDVNFKDKLLTVQRSISRGVEGSTKGNKIRYIPLMEDILQMLKESSKKDDFIFSNGNNNTLESITCLRWLHKACYKAGLREIGWHVLRHTFASHLAQNGVSIVVIKELLGHADIKTTMRYSHLTDSAIRGAVETLNTNNGHNMVTIEIQEDKKSEIVKISRPILITKSQ